MRITRHSAWASLSAFVQDAGAFVTDHPLIFAALVGLGFVVFRVSRPRVH